MQLRISPPNLLLTLVLLYSATAAIFYPATFFALLLHKYAWSTLFGLPILTLYILPVAAITAGTAHSPFGYFRETAIGDRFAILVIVIAFWLFMSAFTTLKIRFVSEFGFYADAELAGLDKWSLGTDAWILSRDIVPTSAIAVISVCYVILWSLNFLGTVVYVSVFRAGSERIRYLYAFVMTWVILGTVMAAALSSAGPILFDRTHGIARFPDLLSALKSSLYTNGFLAEANYLTVITLHTVQASAQGFQPCRACMLRSLP